MEKPISKQGIFDVIKSMKLNKRPGFDGLPIEFYIIFWLDIRDVWCHIIILWKTVCCVFQREMA